jgi:hypothetical protein
MPFLANTPVEKMTGPYARRWWALLVLCLSLLIVVMANTSLIVAAPDMTTDLAGPPAHHPRHPPGRPRHRLLRGRPGHPGGLRPHRRGRPPPRHGLPPRTRPRPPLALHSGGTRRPKAPAPPPGRLLSPLTRRTKGRTPEDARPFKASRLANHCSLLTAHSSSFAPRGAPVTSCDAGRRPSPAACGAPRG